MLNVSSVFFIGIFSCRKGCRCLIPGNSRFRSVDVDGALYNVFENGFLF